MKKSIMFTSISILLVMIGLLVVDSLISESKAKPTKSSQVISSTEPCSVPLYNYKNHIGRPCYGCEELQYRPGEGWVWVLVSISTTHCEPTSLNLNCIAYTCNVSETCRVVVSHQDSCDQGPWGPTR